MGVTIKYIDVKGVQIPLIFEEQKTLPILNLQLVFQNSGYAQDKDESGLASLSSKLLNEGTKELGVTKFAEQLEENAISLNTSNGFETFVIELSNLKEQSNKGINLLTQLLKSLNKSESFNSNSVLISAYIYFSCSPRCLVNSEVLIIVSQAPL